MWSDGQDTVNKYESFTGQGIPIFAVNLIALSTEKKTQASEWGEAYYMNSPKTLLCQWQEQYLTMLTGTP